MPSDSHDALMEGLDTPGAILPLIAAVRADATALITRTRTLTYGELDDLSGRVAAALAERGVREGDRVSLYGPNRWEWIVSYHGALRAGAVVNPINVMLTPPEVRYVLRDCGSRALLAGGAQLDGLGRLTEEIAKLVHVIGFDSSLHATASFDELLAASPSACPDLAIRREDPSTIGYTSGTTGHPKGAVQSHEAVVLNCVATAAMHGRSDSDVLVTALPAPHVYGNVAINSVFLGGHGRADGALRPGGGHRADGRAPGDHLRGRAGDVRHDAGAARARPRRPPQRHPIHGGRPDDRAEHHLAPGRRSPALRCWSCGA